MLMVIFIRMEYKYMRLVEGAQGKEGELPAAQTCAWSDDDEEEELNNRVAFKTKGDQLFGKLGNNSKVITNALLQTFSIIIFLIMQELISE